MDFFALKRKGLNFILSSDTARDFVNEKAGRYAVVHSMSVDDRGYLISFSLLGQTDRVEARIGRIEVRGDSLILFDLSASQPWAQNLFADFLEGRELPAPESPFLRKLAELIV